MSLPMIIGLVLVSVFAFAALVLLMSYSDELRDDEPVIATATDPSAVGYTGLQTLLTELGYEVKVDPYQHKGNWNGRDFRLYFPTGAFSEDRLERIDPYVPGLFILPKWQVVQIAPDSPEVIRRSNPGLSSSASRILDVIAPDTRVHASRDVLVDWTAPGTDLPVSISYPRWIGEAPPEEDVDETEAENSDTETSEDETQNDEEAEDNVEVDVEENALTNEEQIEEALQQFIRFSRIEFVDTSPPTDVFSSLYPADDPYIMVLAEPDFLSNHGIATQSRSEAALALLSVALDYYDIEDPVFVFDDNLRRRDTSQNLVKLLTRPPFLAATLCLLMAGALIGWQGFNRFGDAAREGDDAPDTASRGPRALAESAAQFILGAGRIDALAPNYADVVRRQAIEAMGVSVWDRARADAAIRSRETVRDISPSFDTIRSNITLTPISRARALQRWKEEITR
jgi:hypothetical protein